jgi:hypothetical protein
MVQVLHGNAHAALGVHNVHEQGTERDWTAAYTQRGRRPVVGQCRRCAGGVVGEVAAGGLSPTPLSTRVRSGEPRGFRRG